MTRLLLPDPDRYEEWCALVVDHEDEIPHGSGMWWVTNGSTRAGFAEHLESSRLNADTTLPPLDGRVPCTQWWISDDAGALVGFIQLRHSLTDFLLERGGHIGYSIRTSRQREGHATRALALALTEARRLGIDRALVTCDEDNVASRRTIESQGGVLEDVRNGTRRYWIDCPDRGPEVRSATVTC